jgi:hypothetical protein
MLTYKPGDESRPRGEPEPDLPFPGGPVPARRLRPGSEPAE